MLQKSPQAYRSDAKQLCQTLEDAIFIVVCQQGEEQIGIVAACHENLFCGVALSYDQ